MAYKQLKLDGEFGLAPCFCEYQIGKCDKHTWILIRQPKIDQPHQYITMKIEDLATEIYFKEIPSVDPKLVRIIEYYPPDDFPGNVYPKGFAEQALQRAYEDQGFIKRLLKIKKRFIAFVGTPSGHNFPSDNPIQFLTARGIVI